jgi:hypothetical protein
VAGRGDPGGDCVAGSGPSPPRREVHGVAPRPERRVDAAAKQGQGKELRRISRKSRQPGFSWEHFAT